MICDNSILATMHELMDIDGIEKVLPSGSRFTCDPPVMGTDVDFALLVHNFEPVILLKELGYETPTFDKEYLEESVKHFITMRKDNINLIVMTKPRFQLFEAATTISKKLNLLKKEDQVFVFVTLRNMLLVDEGDVI